MLMLHSLFQRRTGWGVAVLTGVFVGPAIAQTYADVEHTMSHRQQARAAQVKNLRQQMTELSQNLESNQAGAEERISHLWGQVTQLAG